MKEELKFITDFISNYDLNDLTYSQIRSLWTSLCLRFDVNPDTYTYDWGIEILWEAVLNNLTNLYRDDEFKDFDGYMCEFLI